MRVRAWLRTSWPGVLALTVITGLVGGVVLAALAGAHRTQTAVPQFLRYSGPTEGQVEGNPGTLDRVAALPGVAWTQRVAFVLAFPATGQGQLAVQPGQVITWALVHQPPQSRVMVVAGHPARPGQTGQAMLNEGAAQLLHAHVGSLIRLRGYRPSQVEAVLNGAALAPSVALPAVRVAAIIRTPTDLGSGRGAPSDVTYIGHGALYVTAAFYQRYAARVGNQLGLAFHLRRGAAGIAAFETEVRRAVGGQTQVQVGSDDATAAAAAERATSLQALALLVFGLLLALALVLVVGQSVARLTWSSADDFPALRTLGMSGRQLALTALAPGILVAVGSLLLAVPAGFALSVFTPIGLARQAEISPGLSFDAPVLLGGAAALALLLAARAALSAWPVARHRATLLTPPLSGRQARVASWLARSGFPVTAVSGARLAFGPGRGRSAIPVRSAVSGMMAAITAVTATLVFGSSLSHVITDPAVAGWNWNVTVGNPHSGDLSAPITAGLGRDPDVTAFTGTALGDSLLDGQDVQIVGLKPGRGQVEPPVLAGRLPSGPGEIALAGRDLRALGKKVGDQVTAQGPRGPVELRITGQIVLSPEITNEQVALGHGGVMTLAGADVLSRARLPVNLFLVRLRPPAGPAAVAKLKHMFPGSVLPALAPPEILNLRGVDSLPVILALLLTALAVSIVAHTLSTSVRRRRGDLAVLKVLGFTGPQVRLTVAWQSTLMAGASLVAGLPLGLALGRLAWLAFARGFAIEPVPVISPLLLLAVPALLLLANLIAAVPARTAARTRPALTLRAE
jgi:putative ABC transport system permease protein